MPNTVTETNSVSTRARCDSALRGSIRLITYVKSTLRNKFYFYVLTLHFIKRTITNALLTTVPQLYSLPVLHNTHQKKSALCSVPPCLQILMTVVVRPTQRCTRTRATLTQNYHNRQNESISLATDNYSGNAKRKLSIFT